MSEEKVSAEEILKKGLFNRMEQIWEGNRLKIRLYSVFTDEVYELEYEILPGGKKRKIKDSGVSKECLKRIESAYRQTRVPRPRFQKG